MSGEGAAGEKVRKSSRGKVGRWAGMERRDGGEEEKKSSNCLPLISLCAWLLPGMLQCVSVCKCVCVCVCVCEREREREITPEIASLGAGSGLDDFF